MLATFKICIVVPTTAKEAPVPCMILQFLVNIASISF